MGFLAGVATVLSPCILPILPIMLSGAVGGRSRPYGILIGFVFSFALFTVFATFIVQSLGVDINLLRYIAAGVLALLDVMLLFPALQSKINSMIKIPQLSSEKRQGFMGGLATGATLGLVWAPCAGPILAAVITLAATAQAGWGSFLIILSYALGTGIIMLIIILASREVLEKVKVIYKHLDKIHRVFGILVIIAALGIATGYDRKVQAYIIEATPEGWTSFLQSFEENEAVLEALDNLENKDTSMDFNIKEKNLAPDIRDIEAWINSEPLSLEDLRGKVVLVDFWTYSCINCIRTLPYIESWHEKYKDDGLVIIGVHAPEFAFEKDLGNVQKAVKEYGLQYPIALDNNFSTWKAYNNRYWPAKYFIDRDGYLRHYHFGEGEYKESEELIRQLLAEEGQLPQDELSVEDNTSFDPRQTPETYLGYWRLANFKNQNELVRDEGNSYQLVDNLKKDDWTIGGDWRMEYQNLDSTSDNARLKLKFSAKNVFLVMGSQDTREVKVMLNGQELGASDRGSDVNDSNIVQVKEHRLYKLIESDQFIEDGILELIFPDGVELYAFTFGS